MLQTQLQLQTQKNQGKAYDLGENQLGAGTGNETGVPHDSGRHGNHCVHNDHHFQDTPLVLNLVRSS